MRTFNFVLATVAYLLLAGQALAADTLPLLTSAKLAEILTAATGKPATVTKPEAGVEVVSIVENGSYDFIMSSCTASGCPDVQMTMFFNKEDIFTLALVNGFNGKDLSATAFLTPDNRVYLVDLYVVEGGVTEENVKKNLAIYLKAPRLFAQYAVGQTTASLPPAGVPVALGPTEVAPQLQFIERVLRNIPRKGHALAAAK